MSILIAGAGPAGSYLAIKLAENGVPVTLVEKLSSPNKNVFSSAAIPLNTVEKFDLPKKCISSKWTSWQIYDPYGTSHQWNSKNPLGYVLDFASLREELWLKATKVGVELLLGFKVINVNSKSDYAEVNIISNTNKKLTKNVQWVIDATGSSRSLMADNLNSSVINKANYINGKGIEFLLQPSQDQFNCWSNKLSFFLGTRWIKYGYGWIFPMSNNRLKVGVCHLPPTGQMTMSSLISDLSKLIAQMDLDTADVIDKHGGVISSTVGRSEAHYKQRVIGVGDSISTANLLGGEGIRHALMSAEILGSLLVKMLNNPKSNLSNNFKLISYKRSLKRQFNWRWGVSNRLARRTWWGLSSNKKDLRLLRLIEGLSNKLTAEDISELLFDYRFERYGLRVLPYLIGVK